jgi:molybdopterin molybdotransferase
MRGFKRRAEVADVLRLLEERVKPLEPRRVPSFNAHGRVLAERVTSPVAVPGFDRAAMDGFAVRGEDTFGASELAPLALRLAGMSVPGSPALGSVGRGEAMPIMTGAPMPPGADAVLMAEDAQGAGDSVRATAAVPPGKNVSKRGEDIREGEVIFEPGRTLRPQDLGMLAACGIAHVRVRAWPSVTVFATGAELLAPGASPRGCCIVDSNTPMLASLVERDGGSVAEHGIRHDENQLRQSLQASTSDVILVSGGSSVGREDFVPSIVRELGELPVHGVAMRPSSPTGVGFIGGRPVFLLPGNPVSCLCAYDFFAGPTIRALGGRSRDWPYRRVDLPLARKITSEAGRVDYARVRVVDGKVEPLMVSGAGILSSTTRADGFVIVPRDAEGIPEDATVTVYLYG